MSAPHSMTTGTPGTSRAEPLSSLLRRRTRAAHAGAEVAFQLDAALVDRWSYAALLGRLQGFYRLAERGLHAVAGWAELDPPIDVRARARSTLLDDDLHRLGSTRIPGRADPASRLDPPALLSLAGGLGWLYVLEGSALGGQVVARRARAALGDGLPVSFFSSAGRRPGPNWRELQHALDRFGAASGPAAAEQVVRAATDSFEQFGQWISGESSRS